MRRNTVNSSTKASYSARISSLDLDLPRRRGINTGDACTFNHFVSLLLCHNAHWGSYSKPERPSSVQAEVELLIMPTLSCCFPYCGAPIISFIYPSSQGRMYGSLVYFFVIPLSKQQSVAKCSFVCALRGLMGCTAE